jgi:formamidase
MLGKLGHFLDKAGKDEEWDRIASEAARTVPGRENGGNCDIKNLSRGCIIYFPVFVPGANLSMGDMHFSQGDGEVRHTCSDSTILYGGYFISLMC